jgi:hypothetical protein
LHCRCKLRGILPGRGIRNPPAEREGKRTSSFFNLSPPEYGGSSVLKWPNCNRARDLAGHEALRCHEVLGAQPIALQAVLAKSFGLALSPISNFGVRACYHMRNSSNQLFLLLNFIVTHIGYLSNRRIIITVSKTMMHMSCVVLILLLSYFFLAQEKGFRADERATLLKISQKFLLSKTPE